MPFRLDRASMGVVAAVFVAAATAAAATVASSQASGPTGEEIARNGVPAQGTPACASCHGRSGEGVPGLSAPRLAGIDARYLAHELQAFRDGARRNDTMQAVARTLKPGQIGVIVGYFAGLPAQSAAGPGDPKRLPLGRQLAQQGDWSRGAPPCASCHGPQGLGVGASFPPIAGQDAGYIERQLLQFQSGARGDDPLGLMRAVAGRLTPGEIKAAAAYYAGLPVHPAAAPQTGGRR